MVNNKIRLESLSKNVVKTMEELSKNEGLARLLVNHEENPFEKSVGDNRRNLINPKSKICKIFPYPFDVEATVEQGAFIRVYYNDGEFDETEVISETHLYIDVIVSKDLWLINNGSDSLIRPYEIMSRITDMIGKRSANSNIRLNIEGWRHLAINTKFDAIRLYCNNFTVET
ncbi:virion structural protein [Bacillus phage vB_BcoS-136]|uniref:Uncharacterized protein n=1 Tax=Bacillus phage vB_BcoS-136 TaxID=2419619 RepID=A0A3G3BVH5_9CAUD|nr:virion structural protein [Bacillus phage vB_BcoS-136]AYP68253.1 hypothetical protein vBBcoS136_00138 [Bacillus phage vB_BcoS-136]